MNKLVSIVLPVYNGEKYLAQSIESVLNQTYKNLELIIVNDCSTDSSEKIILKYKSQDDRIIYVKNDVNSKLPQSLNNGFAVAKGEYYSWTSDDNIYHEDAIETMVKYIEEEPDVSLVCFDYNKIDEFGNTKGIVRVGGNKELLFYNSIGACFLYRSSVAEEIGGYDTSFFLVEDYEYWLRISLYYRIKPIHMILYDYRYHDGNLTAKKKEEIEKALCKLMLNYIKKIERSNISEDEIVYYFMRVIPKETNKIRRIIKKFFFALKHKLYLKILVAKVIKR